jgi:hypothetical protein
MPIHQVDQAIVMPTYSTPSKHSDDAVVSTPETDLNGSLESSTGSISSGSSSASFEHEIADLEKKMEKASITEHRRLELEGKLKPEPLLVENPNRFVLFPIQNIEVCTTLWWLLIPMHHLGQTLTHNLLPFHHSGLGHVQEG